MRALDAIRGIFARLTGALATQRRLLHFRCADCDRAERCGLAPSADCIARATQIERDGDEPRARRRGYQASC